MNSEEMNPAYCFSVIIIFYNMRREAERTLFSLTKTYQKNAQDIPYEVIAIDNGSTQPLDKDWVESFGENFRYVYFDAQTPSPCAALNYGVQIARGNFVMMCIDGARILSPGILHYSLLATKIYPNPFIYTLGMHIGSKQQSYLVDEGYSQKNEDELIASIDWKQDGYLLFDISSVAFSSGNGYFSKLKESNCFAILRSTFQKIGGFDERFTSGGGGLANLDFFNRANACDDINPVMLLGEATFHQFHGGITTNVSRKDHPWQKIRLEYLTIHQKEYQPYLFSPTFFGDVHSRCMRLFSPPEEN